MTIQLSDSEVLSADAKVSAERRSLFRRIDWGAILVTALTVYCLLTRPAIGLPGLSNVEDDLFYYIVVAQQLLAGHGSTFNGMVATNGYHPLWLLVITAMQPMAGGLNQLIQGVYVLICASVLATYLLAKGIFRQFISTRAVPELLALLMAVVAADFLQTGMEIVLAIPLGLFLVLRVLKAGANPTPKEIFLCALLAAMTVLARLDGAFFVLLLAVFLACDRSLRRSMTSKHAIALLAGMLPLLIYFAINLTFFHSLMPVSGQAKQLRLTHHPSLTVFTWRWLNDWQRVLLPLPLIGIAWLSLRYRRLAPRSRATLLAMMAFPYLQFGVLSLLSDWPSWPWYFYSFVIASCGALAILAGDKTRLRAVNSWGARPLIAALSALALLAVVHLHHRFFRAMEGMPRESVLTADFVHHFAASHPGTYAMGDRAGAVAAMMGNPVVQTEGLVMDEDFLVHIRRQENLLDILRSYGVRYYVATSGYRPIVVTAVEHGAPVASGCFIAREPLLAGPDSPEMEAPLCFPPVATYQAPFCKTWIFDLDQAPVSANDRPGGSIGTAEKAAVETAAAPDGN